MFSGIHHIALIVSDYERSKQFYTQTLGFTIIDETFRDARQSWKLDLAIPGGGQLELFSFPNPPARPSTPEACGLRHLAFGVSDLTETISFLENQGVSVEPVRVDAATNNK